MLVTITSFSCKRGLPEEKIAIGNIGTGCISTLAKLDTGRDHLQVAFGCTGGQHRSVYFAERMPSGCWELRTVKYFRFGIHITKANKETQ